VQPRHLYVHVPFCARRCTYCDFAIAVRRVVPVADYLAALDAELRLRWGSSSDWTLDTLYFGGGTPSRLGGEGIARAIDSVRRVAALAPGAEVTIEANPEDVSPVTAREWRAAGVNRVSLGVQSFDDATLRWMHRVHDAARAERAIIELRDAGITNLSIDLIFALPDEVPTRVWERDLERAVALAPPHVSLYGLTVEPHTPLGKSLAVGGITEAGEDRYERDFLLAHDIMTAAGLEHYEVSNFGRAGMHSRHNSAYWRSVPYAGLGPGAHELRVEEGRMLRRWNDDVYVRWAQALAEGRDPIAGDETLTAENRIAEEVYLGLRSTAGLEVTSDERERLSGWVEAGWGMLESETRDEGRREGRTVAGEAGDERRGAPETGLVFRATPLGWLRLDALAADLTAFRSR
jgi:oxygen-independent coproporphyrinogen III oxidase